MGAGTSALANSVLVARVLLAVVDFRARFAVAGVPSAAHAEVHARTGLLADGVGRARTGVGVARVDLLARLTITREASAAAALELAGTEFLALGILVARVLGLALIFFLTR